MFCAPYVAAFLKSNATAETTALASALSGNIFYPKAPSIAPEQYVVVFRGQNYDHGTVCGGVLTQKQESITILLVGSDTQSLQGLWLKLAAAIDSCRNKTVTSTDLGGSMKIQAVITDADGSAESHDGLLLEGQEISTPCIVTIQRASYTNPVLTPP